MGYSRSPRTVERRLPMLKRLLTRPERVEWSPGVEGAPAFARKIHECFYIAREIHSDKFPALAEIAELYEIRVTHDKVIAVRRRVVDQSATVPVVSEMRVDIHDQCNSAAEVIQAWMDHNNFSARFRFHSVELSANEYETVARWGAGMEPELDVSMTDGVLDIQPR